MNIEDIIREVHELGDHIRENHADEPTYKRLDDIMAELSSSKDDERYNTFSNLMGYFESNHYATATVIEGARSMDDGLEFLKGILKNDAIGEEYQEVVKGSEQLGPYKCTKAMKSMIAQYLFINGDIIEEEYLDITDRFDMEISIGANDASYREESKSHEIYKEYVDLIIKKRTFDDIEDENLRREAVSTLRYGINEEKNILLDVIREKYKETTGRDFDSVPLDDEDFYISIIRLQDIQRR